MNISKLTITSICSQYKTNIMEITSPSTQRAAELVKERLYARDCFYLDDGLPRFMSNLVPPNRMLKDEFVTIVDKHKNLIETFLAKMNKKLGPFLNK